MANGTPFDDDLIPRGDHCYHSWAASDPATREVYMLMHPQDTCPYWRETRHGTIRCERLGVEAVIEWSDYENNVRMAEATFGVEGFERIRVPSTFLTDQIKICKIHPDVPGYDEPEGDDVLNWRHV